MEKVQAKQAKAAAARFGYGVTKRWYTEVFASYIGSPEQPLKPINCSTSAWNFDAHHSVAPKYRAWLAPLAQVDWADTPSAKSSSSAPQNDSTFLRQ